MKPSYSELESILSQVPDAFVRGYAGPDLQTAPKPMNQAPHQVSTGSVDAHDELRISGAGSLEEIAALVASCRRCRLCEGRTKTVPGTGSGSATIMVIGEGPGADEDRLGLPFVGAAGQYLDKWLESISLSRYTNTFIANIVKCRPPSNRDPLPDEIEQCTPYLFAQISLLKPKAILAVGRIASAYLKGEEVRMGQIHGSFFEFRGVPWMPTYHPSAVLRDQSLKRPVWEDLKTFKTRFLSVE